MENLLSQITKLYNHPLFIIVGGLTVTLGVIGLLYKVFCWIFGITPIIIRLGIALWKRKVAIFGSVESFESIKSSLLDSKIFKEKNIVYIESNNIDKAKDETIFLVDWETSEGKIEQIFSSRKNHQTAIVIYAKPTSISQKKNKRLRKSCKYCCRKFSRSSF